MAIERDKEKFHHIVEIDAFTGRNIYRHETLFSEEEYFEDITHPNLNSIHVTMTDFDSNDMQLKHRCVEHHAASDDGHRIGHVNNAYFDDELLPPPLGAAAECGCVASQPHVFHMDAYDSTLKEYDSFDVEESGRIGDLTQGAKSPPYMTPPTSPEPPLLEPISAKSSITSSAARYTPTTSFIEQQDAKSLSDLMFPVLVRETSI